MPFSEAFNAFMKFFRNNGNAFDNPANDVYRLGGLWSFAKPPDGGGGGNSCHPQMKKADSSQCAARFSPVSWLTVSKIIANLVRSLVRDIKPR
jgi:hypothetical protein